MEYLENEHNWDVHVTDKNGDDAYLCAILKYNYLINI